MNMLDYLDWRGDLDFIRDPLNEVDNLILSILSYNDFEGIVSGIGEGESISLREAAKIFQKTKEISHLEALPFLKEVPKLLSKAANTTRFGEVKLSNFVNQIDMEKIKQFSAVVFSISQELHFLAFRGTDDSLAGWRESFQMSFMGEIQSQGEAVKFVNTIVSQEKGQFILGGHSKGGNLSVYAASKMDGKLRDRVISIYNNDGPGFQPETIQSIEYQSMGDKIITLLPESSIVGMLLEHRNDYKVIKSSGIVLMQHNPFLWEVMGKGFVFRDGLTERSLHINSAIGGWLTQLSKDERAQFAESLFTILQETGASTLGELSRKKLNAAETMIKAIKNMDKTTKSHLKSTFDLLFLEGQKILKKTISEDIEEFVAKGKNKFKIKR